MTRERAFRLEMATVLRVKLNATGRGTKGCERIEEEKPIMTNPFVFSDKTSFGIFVA